MSWLKYTATTDKFASGMQVELGDRYTGLTDWTIRGIAVIMPQNTTKSVLTGNLSCNNTDFVTGVNQPVGQALR